MCSIHQEARLKHFKQQLEQVLESFYSVQEAIDPAIRPLMAPHIEAVVRYVMGVTVSFPGHHCWSGNEVR